MEDINKDEKKIFVPEYDGTGDNIYLSSNKSLEGFNDTYKYSDEDYNDGTNTTIESVALNTYIGFDDLSDLVYPKFPEKK